MDDLRERKIGVTRGNAESPHPEKEGGVGGVKYIIWEHLGQGGKGRAALL